MSATFGRYRLLEKLGQGGMAEVFKAKSYGVEGFEKVLVIKRILPELGRSQNFVEMFVHEAKLAVRLSHANIVQVFDLGVASGVDANGSKEADAYYIAMEYVHGLDLATLLARARRDGVVLPVELGGYVASEIAKGLDHAHRRRDEQMRPLGIVHRDVSPQNILVSFEGEVKVTDFGIAKARGLLDASPPDAGDKTPPSQRRLRGKYGYMSPEQARGESVDTRSDLFSLGSILFECVTGVSPFGGTTPAETLRRVQACEHPPVEALRRDVPRELAAILRTAMAPSPADRYGDAGRMYEALLAFLYAHGGRYGARDLAELLPRFRAGPSSTPATTSAPVRESLLDGTSSARTERTPVEIPASRSSAHLRPTGTSAPPPSQGPLDRLDRAPDLGERREVTALWIDLPRAETSAGASGVGTSSAGTSSVPTASSAASVEAVLSKASAIVERWGGRVMRRVLQPSEAALGALFGLDEPDGLDTEMATRCGLDVLRGLDATPAPGAGIHIGRITLVGGVGGAGAGGVAGREPKDDGRLASVLDAARELAKVRPGHAAISSQAMRQVRARFEFEAVGDGDRPASTVSGVLVTGVRSPSEARGRFVGREDELKRIGELLGAATRRSARVLTIRGDTGIGKTRLLYEVERRLTKNGYRVGFHIAACPPRGTGLPLSGIASMLHALCGTAEGEANDRILAAQPRLSAFGLSTDEVNVVLCLLGANVRPPGGNTKLLVRLAFTQVVQSLCEDQLHAFAWDAAHLMDADSFEVLTEALQRLVHTRVVFVFAGRAGFAHPMAGFESQLVLDLGDLSLPEVERLVALRLGVTSVPEELLRLVSARAGGHPLFVEEVIRGLVAAGALTVADKRVVAMKLAGQELALPKTLRGLVASRVARLSPEDRATLRAAAVIGDPADVGVLAKMLNQPAQTLERSIAALTESALVVRASPNELHFVSPVVPEVVADALTPEAARELHAAAAQTLEGTLALPTPEHAWRIAQHLYVAGDRDRAADYYAKSAEERARTQDLDAAVRGYAHALEAVDPSGREPRVIGAWLDGLAQAARVVRLLPDAQAFCTGVIENVDRAGARADRRKDSHDLRVQARVASGAIMTMVNELEGARHRLAEARTMASGEPGQLRAVLVAQAELASHEGNFRRAGELLDEVARLGRPDGSGVEAAVVHRAFVLRAQATGASGDRSAAVALLREAERLLPDDRIASLDRSKARLLVDVFTRDFASAALHAERALDQARELGLKYDEAVGLHNLADVLIRLNEGARAAALVEESLALCEARGYERLATCDRMRVAYLDGLQGSADAETRLRDAIAVAASRRYLWDVLGGRLLLADLLARRGAVEGARIEYEDARASASSAGQRLVADDCERALQRIASAALPPPSSSVTRP